MALNKMDFIYLFYSFSSIEQPCKVDVIHTLVLQVREVDNRLKIPETVHCGTGVWTLAFLTPKLVLFPGMAQPLMTPRENATEKRELPLLLQALNKHLSNRTELNQTTRGES